MTGMPTLRPIATIASYCVRALVIVLAYNPVTTPASAAALADPSESPRVAPPTVPAFSSNWRFVGGDAERAEDLELDRAVGGDAEVLVADVPRPIVDARHQVPFRARGREVVPQIEAVVADGVGRALGQHCEVVAAVATVDAARDDAEATL